MNQLSAFKGRMKRFPESGGLLTTIVPIHSDRESFSITDWPETEFFARFIDVVYSYPIDDDVDGQRGMICKRFRTRKEAFDWIETQLPF